MNQLATTGRKDVLEWLHRHPRSVHGDVALIVARAERETRRHAREDAWSEARDYIRQRRVEWQRGWGFHASDAYVALEVCPRLARALRNHERHVQQGDERHLVGEELMALIEPEALDALAQWTIDVGEREHHRIWEEIIRYTRKRGRELVRDGQMRRDLDWDHCENFAAKAAQVAEILIREFDSRTQIRA
jgi:hypothetical protein